jgi:hypothetical protein
MKVGLAPLIVPDLERGLRSWVISERPVGLVGFRMV